MRYAAYAKVEGTKFLGFFDADSEEAAITKARKSGKATVNLCDACHHECEDAEVQEVTVERQG